ncbi:immunity protein YezG family protein [Vibrio atypicus]|uniref:immunity protein YezG family protein n=1 Tax=Vibrio atypicus TaxID=558271 RepID=UPI003736BA10
MKSIDALYLEIAQRIVNAIGDEWEKAVINFQYFGDAGEYTGRYYKTDADDEHHFKVGYQSYKAFKSIHKISTENGSNIWNRARFTLYPSGKFNIEFEWDQALEDDVNANS